MVEVLAKIPEGPYYLTIDADGVDPSIMPAVLAQTPGGLNWLQLHRLIPCLSGCHPHPLYVWCGDKWLGRRTKRGWMFCSGKTSFGAYINSPAAVAPVLVAMRSPKRGFSGHGPLCWYRLTRARDCRSTRSTPSGPCSELLAMSPLPLTPSFTRAIQLHRLIHGLVDRGRVLGMDLVEIAPSYDMGITTLVHAERLICNFIGATVRAGYYD